MSNQCFIIIREYRPSDRIHLNEVLKNAYSTSSTKYMWAALQKEIVFEAMVFIAAIMFIFLRFSMTSCILSAPFVLVVTNCVVYLNGYIKVNEMTESRPFHCWVAEAVEPALFLCDPRHIYYTFTHARYFETIPVSHKSKVVGTVAVKQHNNLNNSIWLHWLAVDKKYRRKGIAEALVHTVVTWTYSQSYDCIETSITECQEDAKELLMKIGFQLSQMYHKQYLIVTICIFRLKYSFVPNV